MDNVNKQEAMILFCGSASGCYIPQRFAAEIMPQYLRGVSQDELNELADPDSEWYWDTWDRILCNATVVDGDLTYYLHQSEHGDLWLICDELLTDEERENLYGEYC